MEETRSVESVANFTLVESMDTFIMQLNNALKEFDTLLIVHSTSPFCTVKCLGYWTAHDDFQGSILRFDYGQLLLNLYSYKILHEAGVNKFIRPRCSLDFWTRQQAEVKKSRKHQGFEHLSPAKCGIAFTTCQHFDEYFIVVIKSFYIMESLIILGNYKLLTPPSFSMELVRVFGILSTLQSERKWNPVKDFGWRRRKPIKYMPIEYR